MSIRHGINGPIKYLNKKNYLICPKHEKKWNDQVPILIFLNFEKKILVNSGPMDKNKVKCARKTELYHTTPRYSCTSCSPVRSQQFFHAIRTIYVYGIMTAFPMLNLPWMLLD